jgi:hypothetical protein
MSNQMTPILPTNNKIQLFNLTAKVIIITILYQTILKYIKPDGISRLS